MYETDHSLAHACGVHTVSRVCACAVIDERVTGVCGLCACLCRVAVAGSRPIIVQREITPLIISLPLGLGAPECGETVLSGQCGEATYDLG